MELYTCYTDLGKWDFEAYNDRDALRLAFTISTSMAKTLSR